MPEYENVLLLVGDALIDFIALATVLRLRSRIGLGAFFCALRVMRFLETYLVNSMSRCRSASLHRRARLCYSPAN